MGQDIHAYVEYGDALHKEQLGRFRIGRWYDLFAFMATGGSSRRPNIQPAFTPRGLPDDMDIFTQSAYEDDDHEYTLHHVSWLTLAELKQVHTDYLSWFREQYPTADLPILEDIRAMTAAMGELEHMGYKTRLVFWFDN